MVQVRVILLLVASLSSAAAAAGPDTEVVRASIVQVAILDGAATVRVGSGFAVATTGAVVTAAHLVAGEDRIVVVPLTTGTELVARVEHRDDRADLALLSVRGLDLPPLKLAMDGFDPGRLVYAVGAWSTGAEPGPEFETSMALAVSEGSVGSDDELPADDDGPVVPLLVHNAMIPAAGYGGPLLNECGEIAGLNRGAPGVAPRRLRRGAAPENVVHAVNVTSLAAILGGVGVAIEQSEGSCTGALADAQARAEAAAAALEETTEELEETTEELEETTEQLEEATEQAEVAQEQLENTQREKDAAAARAAEADGRVGELEAQYEEALRSGSAQAEDLRAQLEAARGEHTDAQAVAGALENQVTALQGQLQRQAEADRIRMIATSSTVAAVLLVALGVGFMVRRRHTRQLAIVREEAAHARKDGLHSRASVARQDDYPDALLTGETGDGDHVSLKIPGALLGGDGAVIGRSPRNSTLLIDDQTLSREHARFFGDGDVIYIEDLGSTNGTRLNGRQLPARTPSAIAHGDALELGGAKLRLTTTG